MIAASIFCCSASDMSLRMARSYVLVVTIRINFNMRHCRKYVKTPFDRPAVNEREDRLDIRSVAADPFTISALRVYAAQGILSRLSGILMGRPGGQIPPCEFPKYDAVQKVVVEEEGLDHLPIVTRMDFGHTDPMFILPYGITAQIDCEQRKFFIVENAVEDN